MQQSQGLFAIAKLLVVISIENTFTNTFHTYIWSFLYGGE